MNALIVALVVIGASLLIVEAHVASYGVFGVLGIAALSGAAVLAAEAAGGSAAVALALVLPAAILMSALTVVATHKALAMRRRRPRAGPEDLIGRIGVMQHGDVLMPLLARTAQFLAQSREEVEGRVSIAGLVQRVAVDEQVANGPGRLRPARPNPQVP